MHSVDLLEEALQLAQQAGFEIRREWLGESTGGACRIGTRWVLFVDLSLPAHEQLMQVIKALKNADFFHADAGLSPPLRRLLH
ncbi:MAG: hypothetical protein KDA45_04680 [Planctomycetales bacterium]|nr:hypothetical protein [Planctomycetales bacterium]